MSYFRDVLPPLHLRKRGRVVGQVRRRGVKGREFDLGARDGRDELTSIMEFVREGDELVVLKLDRLGRNTRDVLNLVHDLRQRGAVLIVLEPKFATTDVAGPILVTVLGMVAELERSFIRERQKAGIARAKANGVYKGRKPTVPVERVRAMHRDGVGPSAIARELGISRMSVHRVLKARSSGLASRASHGPSPRARLLRPRSWSRTSKAQGGSQQESRWLQN